MLNPGEGRVLVLLLDTSIGMWEQLRRNDLQKTSAGLSQLNQANFISQVLQFLNTYLMMQEGNKATVFAVDGSGRCAFSSTLVFFKLCTDIKRTTLTLQSFAAHSSGIFESVQIQATRHPVSSRRSAPHAATALASQ